MHRYFIFAIIMYLSATDLLAQHQLQQYSRVKINLTGRDINDLAKAGIETDHGLFVKNKFFISDFSNVEIEIIKNLKFETEVLVADVAAYYAVANRPSELTKSAKRGSGCGGQSQNEYNYTRPLNYKDGSMGGYYTYDEMLLVLDSMVAKFPHLISQRQDIDTLTTYQGNRLFYVKLSDHVAEDEISEPKVLYTALHHAREPNGLTQMVYYMWYLLENYGIDPIVTRIVNETQLYFVPCVNPDGYKLNESTNPLGGGLWRKNMWRDTSGALMGVDLNRNYGHFWGFDNIGSSNNPNSQTYRGTDGFSEPETKSIRNLCTKIEFSMALNYHTFGNYLIHPWGYSDKPTDEDKLYKIIAKEMNKENQFTVGTGTETVGYVVNGDSDDWMYGANDEKKAIFAFTPEVGPSFWPPQVDIDYLNRSCMWMNLSTALMTLSHYTAEEEVKSSYFSPENKSVFINVSRAGLKDGKCQITLKSATPGVMVEDMAKEVILNRGENIVLEFKLDIENTVSEGEILLQLEVKNGDVVTSSTISKTWINSNFIDIKYDSINNVGSFTSDYWSLTGQTYFSSPACLTDSPDGLYLDNFKSEVILGEPIDLSKTSQAFLNFYAKWDIEKGYDYVQIQASSNNRDFIPLCGLHTVYGTQNQSFNSPLYDGTQADWVREEMDLTYFVGQPKVWIRAIIKSDEGVQKDGFYMDDLRVQVVPTGTTAVTDDKVDVLCFGQNQSNRFFSSGTEIVTDVLPGNDIYYSHINDQGISIYSLAKIFQVSTEMVLKVNKIDPKDPNYDGKIVKIPIKKSRISLKPAAKSPKTNTLTLVYKVKKGETLYRIAKDYLNTDVKSLMSLNGKTTPDLNTGDSLIIGYLTVQNLDNRQITSKNPDPKIDFDTKNKAQRPSNILKTPVNTDTSDEVKIVKYYLSDVIGFWDKSPSSHNNNFVLHNEAKPGTMMDVYNPMLKRHVRAKVLGKIPQSTYAEEVQIIINSSVARELGILDQRFKVNIKYEM